MRLHLSQYSVARSLMTKKHDSHARREDDRREGKKNERPLQRLFVHPLITAFSVLLRRELEHGLLAEGLPWFQNRSREVRVIWGIRIMLSFKAQAKVFLVGMALFSDDGAVEEISRVELDSGLGGGNFHHAAAGRFVDAGSKHQT